MKCGRFRIRSEWVPSLRQSLKCAHMPLKSPHTHGMHYCASSPSGAVVCACMAAALHRWRMVGRPCGPAKRESNQRHMSSPWIDMIVSTAEERTIPRLVQPAHLLQELLHLRSVQRCANHHCFAAGTRGKHSAQSRGAAPAAHV